MKFAPWLMREMKLSVVLCPNLGRVVCAGPGGGSSDVQWCFSQVKGAMDDDVAEGKSVFCV